MPYLLNVVYLTGLLILSPWLVFRRVATGRYRHGLSQKLLGARPESSFDNRPTIWFHGVSVGEINLLSTVIQAFRRRHPEWRCVVSTTTETGMAEARKKFGDLTVIRWPFDFSWAVNRTIKSQQPRLVVLAESELWPNFLHAASRWRVPVLVINGRMSPRTAGRYRLLGKLGRSLLLDRVDRFAMQSAAYARLLEQIGIAREKISITGSVKYDGVLGDRSNSPTRKLGEQLGLGGQDIVWVAGSTHAPEEQIVLNVYSRLRVRYPFLRLLLAPRSADRFDEAARLIERGGLPFVRRSRLTEPPAERPAVILLDSIGELNAAWGLADVGFTGGSLDGKRGGQSMIEPAGLGVPVVFGPFVWNFRDAAERLLEANGAFQVSTLDEMYEKLARLLAEPDLRRQMGESARNLVIEQQGATSRTLDIIDQLLSGGRMSRQTAA